MRPAFFLVAFLALGAMTQAFDFEAVLDHQFQFNESTGSVVSDFRGNGTFNAVNSPTWVSSNFPSAAPGNNTLNFTGTSAQSMNSTTPALVNWLNGRGAWTICMWVYKTPYDAGGNFEYLLHLRSGTDSTFQTIWEVETNSSRVQGAFTADNGTQQGLKVDFGKLNLNAWNFLCVTGEPGVGLKAYLNGTQTDSFASAYTVMGASTAMADWEVGRPGAGSYFNGQITGLSFFNATLNASLISDLYLYGGNAPGSAPGLDLTIHAPTNTSYIDDNLTLNFTGVSNTSTSFSCWGFLDGAYTALGNATNNTPTTHAFTSVDPGLHNVTVACDNAGMNSSATVFATTAFYNFTETLSPSRNYTYEAAGNLPAGFHSVAQIADNVANVSAFLYWNASTRLYSCSACNNTDANYSGLIDFQRSVVSDLVTANNTNVSYFWSYNVTYTNGTVAVVNGSTYTMPVWWSYYSSSVSATPSSVYSGLNFTAALAYAAPAIGATTVNRSAPVTSFLTFNGSNTTIGPNVTPSGVSATLTAPALANASDAWTLSASFLINLTEFGYSSLVYRDASHSATVDVYLGVLTNCTNGTAAFNFTFFQEENPTTVLNASMAAAFTVWDVNRTVNTTYNFSWSNVSSAAVCLSALPLSVSVDSFQTFESNYATAYPARSYFLANASASNSSTVNKSLYLLDSVNAKLVQFTVSDTAGNDLAGYTIQAARYYPDLDQYLLVAMGKTGSDGTTGMYLLPNDVWIRFYAYNGTVLVQTFDPQVISCDPAASYCSVVLIIDGTPLETYFSKAQSVAVDCSYNSSATRYTCVYSDPSASLSFARLQVWQQGPLQNSTVCDTNGTSAAGSLYCDFNVTAGTSFYAAFSVGFSPATVVFGEALEVLGTYAFAGTPAGWLIAFLLFMAVSGVALWDPSYSVILGLGSLALSLFMGLVFFSWAAFMGLVVAGAIVVWGLKGRWT